MTSQNRFFACRILVLALACFASGCKPSIGPGKPLSQLTPEEARGHATYGSLCGSCHLADSANGLHGPGLKGLYRKPYLPSGAPSRDDRVRAVILHGRNMMPGYANNLDDQQLNELIAYLHTL